MPLSAEDNYACRIVRSDRPCLVCPGKMDLVEAHPRYNLFSGLPLCSSEVVDCLDCPRCGFSTSTSDYQYLQICKIQRHGMFYPNSKRGGKLSSSRSRRTSSDAPLCSTCNASLSSKWQFCPGCGSKCVPAPEMSSQSVISVDCKSGPGQATSQSPSDSTSASSGFGTGSSSDSQDTGIVRMVTPPKRHTVDSSMTNTSQVSL